MHGFYDTRNEFSYNSYSNVKDLKILKQDTDITVLQVVLNNSTLLIALANKNFDNNTSHEVVVLNEKLNWNGPYLFKKIKNQN
jgi:hypothetical protein